MSVCQDLLREFHDSNGNGSIPMVMSNQPNQPVGLEPVQEEQVDQLVTRASLEAEKRSSQGCGLASFKEASHRAASVFSVQNPHTIDSRARTLFPLAFLVVNILYWLYYLLF